MKVLMFSSDPGAQERMRKYGEILDKLEIVFFDRSRGRFSRFFKGYFEAKRILAGERYDLITAQEVEHSFLAWLLSRKFGVPWQMQIHTDIFSSHYVEHSMFNRIRVWLVKFLIPRANCVRVASERIKKSIQRPDAIVLPIFEAIKDMGGANIKEKYPGYDFYILMVGRLSREKNFSLALSAMREIIKKYPQTLLVIAGEGPERKKIEKEILYGLEANVRLEGWQENLSGYYQTSDCLLLTSDYEGYGMAAVEALSYGLPVVMTDVGVAGEIVKNGENGIVVPVGDRTKLAEAILRLRGEKELKTKLAEGAKRTNFPYKSFEEYREKLIAPFRACQK